ncbi:MAG TPA: agmatine deiminase family protein [Phycisphaerales bacterium]|nr:agmatine deiminase family protein [Phycisphaerales bacterium]HMP38368.1 agmatine deiminase family protein [Phycisphaerales bacterium]
MSASDCIPGIARGRPGTLAVAGALTLATTLFGSVAFASGLPAGPGDGPSEETTPLPRWREGGTPFDPNQNPLPYTISTVATDAPGVGLIESPPEYGPTRGVLFRYSAGAWPSVVRACVKALTADPAKDDIAYVVVASQAVANSAAAAFAADGADLSKVVFIIQPTDSIWMRDYGPHFVFQEGTLAIVDSHYYPQRKFDNFIPTLLGEENLLMPTYDVGLYYSGGNFLVGPDRSAFITALINLDNPASQGFNLDLIKEFYSTFQGIDTLHVFPQLPGSVDGTGHIDMWMYIVDESTAIISEFVPGSNGTAISVTNNAVPFMESLGFQVFRPKAFNAGGNHYTYANAFRVNDRIFVPVYGTAIVPGGNPAYNGFDAEAIATWQAAAGPNVEIIPIQCSSIISAAGAIHCIVKQVPRYVETMPSAIVLSPAGGETWLEGSTERIRWNATDTDNVALASVDLHYSLDDGQTWMPIAAGLPDNGSYDWLVPAGASSTARIQAVVHATGGATVAAVSNPYRQARGTATVYDFSANAGVDRFAWGHQTGSWAANVSGKAAPVAIGLTAANYIALATSNATGGNADPNRFIPPTITSPNEATHLFRFDLSEDPASIAEIELLWEGYADRCTQVELYIWDTSRGQWGDGRGLVGQNRYANSFARNTDKELVAHLRNDIGNYLDAAGSLRVLVYAQRATDRTFHDYIAVTVKQLDACTFDLDGNGVVDGADLAAVLAAWGPCSGCPADVDGNGIVDGADLAAILAAWGDCG